MIGGREREQGLGTIFGEDLYMCRGLHMWLEDLCVVGVIRSGDFLCYLLFCRGVSTVCFCIYLLQFSYYFVPLF